MAEAKKDLTILSRDTEFSKTMITRPIRKSPFKIRGEDAVSVGDEVRVDEESNQSTGTSEYGVKPEIQQPMSDTQQRTTDKRGVKVGATRARVSPNRKQATQDRNDGEAMIVCRISFRVADDLMIRAEKLAKTAKCPRQRVVTVAFNELRPKLIEQASKIQEGDIPEDRNTDATGRLDTTLRIAAATVSELERRLDPAGYNGLNSLLSRWARSSFTGFFDEYLKAKGF